MDDRLFRDAMGRFGTGVTIISTESEGNYHAMTANAFMSVSLSPKLVAISIGERAKMNELIQKANKFAVSILSEEQQKMSMHFAGQLKEKEDIEFGIQNNLPIIKDSLVTLTCNVYNSYVAGDHTIYIGEVQDLHLLDGKPLAFYKGSYQRLA